MKAREFRINSVLQEEDLEDFNNLDENENNTKLSKISNEDLQEKKIDKLVVEEKKEILPFEEKEIKDKDVKDKDVKDKDIREILNDNLKSKDGIL